MGEVALSRHRWNSDLTTWLIFNVTTSSTQRLQQSTVKLRPLREGRFVPVYLRVSREENVRRITSSTRVTLGVGKLVDPSVLLLIRNMWDLLEFNGVEGLHFDVTDVDAEEIARRLYQYILQLFVEELLAKGYARRLNATYHLCRITDQM